MVEIRVKNGSDLVLDQATLFLPHVSLEFFDLGPGDESPYVEVDKAYRIASAAVVVGPDAATVHVIDYVGERPLKAGRYTFIFRVFEGEPLAMSLDLDRDS